MHYRYCSTYNLLQIPATRQAWYWVLHFAAHFSTQGLMNINQNILYLILNTVTNVKTTEYVVETELGKRESKDWGSAGARAESRTRRSIA